ncbi:methionyl-tRNA formyltransferase [Peptoniphilus catoniae]|uniref:methionyl-tRNA formyltransferase n=1 Tax=Peptoniphilus catoniae TaxID=1660341 RepID=UPI0010FD1492|nr:methionyl-tRNA formyltransferase [Peptoniphilus catoniae]
MNIVYMSNPDFGIRPMERLNEAYGLSLVVTGLDKRRGRGKKLKPSPVKARAIELGIEVYQPEDINSEESLRYLKSFDPDLFIVVAFGKILSKKALEVPKYSINIHASLLPKLRGAAPINRAILEGYDKSGISIMKMAEGLDTGDVAMVKEVTIEDKSADELSQELSNLGADMIVDFVERFKENKLEFSKQDDSKATYAEKISKEDGYIDFNKDTAKDIERILRAMPERYSISTSYKGERFKIKDLETDYEKTLGSPGEIIDSTKKLRIATLDGSIYVKKLQFPGKKEMDIKSYLAGNSLDKGTILGG